MTFEERKAEILAEHAKRKAEGRYRLPERKDIFPTPIIPSIAKIEHCKYAQDTGKLAFPAAPCRGNRIICQHEKNKGFVSYTKQCKKEKCIFFENI